MRLMLSVMLLFISMIGKGQIAAGVEALPANWTKLTKTEDGLVVYNTCDGGNLRLRLYKEGSKWFILAHGQQEDYLFEVKKAAGNKKIVFDCVPDSSGSKQQFIFSWADKARGIAKWESVGWDWEYTFTSLWDEVNHIHIIQPCTECWDEECEGLDEYYDPIDGIRAIFSNYAAYGESTDSDENKAAMSKALDMLIGKKLSQDDLHLLVNVWMYYDPTDFGDAMIKSRELLVANGSEGIRAVKYMIAHPRYWENKDSAPYSELPLLLKEIEDKNKI